MSNKNTGIYLGFDINNKNTVISFYKTGMAEPETVSTVMGSESFLVPTFIAKKRGVGQWFFGDEAYHRTATGEAIGVEDLYNKAVANLTVTVDGMVYEARDLLGIFFKKLFAIPNPGYGGAGLQKLIICVEQVSVEIMELFTTVAISLNLSPEYLTVIDHRESFYYYMYNQAPELFLYYSALFDYSGTNMVGFMMNRNTKTRPQVVTIDQAVYGDIGDRKDEAFDAILDKAFNEKFVSSVYLVGDGFDGDWMKSSLTKACKGRKVFRGMNLYSKGACYAGYIKDGNMDWPFIYMGDNELKINLSLKVLDDNDLKFYSLIDAGESWYEAKGECEVIIDGAPEIEFWIQKPDSREAHVELVELSDLPERENRTTRIRINAIPISDKSISIKVMDLGFGEIYPSTGKTWEHEISLES